MSREVMQMALDALQYDFSHDYIQEVVEKLRAELAKPDEASAECWAYKGTGIITTSSNGSGLIEDVCMACKED